MSLVGAARSTKRRIQGLSPIAGNFDGFVGSGMAGWRQGGPGGPGRVRLFFGPHLVASAIANLPRPDLAELGGHCGFFIPMSVIEPVIKKLQAQGQDEPQPFYVLAEDDRPLPGARATMAPGDLKAAAAIAFAVTQLHAAYDAEDNA